VIAISPDRPEKIAVYAKEIEGTTFLSDSRLEAAVAMGVAFHASDESVKKLEGYGIDIEDASGQKHHLLPVPSVFILDASGKIKFQYVNPDYKIRIDGETLLAAARAALQ
jgi:peroxiredoxin